MADQEKQIARLFIELKEVRERLTTIDNVIDVLTDEITNERQPLKYKCFYCNEKIAFASNEGYIQHKKDYHKIYR